MNSILRKYLQYIQDTVDIIQVTIGHLDLSEYLSNSEKLLFVNLVEKLENLILWTKSSLYGNEQLVYNPEIKYNIDNTNDSTCITHAVKNILIVESSEENELCELHNNETLSTITRKVLPKICFLTRQVFQYPLSHRYIKDSNINLENICKSHVFEKEALMKYLGKHKKIVCPIAGCNKLIIKRLLIEDVEISDIIKLESLNTSSTLGIRSNNNILTNFVNESTFDLTK
ncbi:hypothetical protein cand_023430 [Cryptosporidium andersoni]|uniref:SP-RING-type domain-containing protein n=1 Tax=Cryptosporidium andersoni TaxID=117008 RepID=A0A1J4MS38_9CRYT|nr:hypothetical protein cand_023430 [Cryptosporidium andersoni]